MPKILLTTDGKPENKVVELNLPLVPDAIQWGTRVYVRDTRAAIGDGGEFPLIYREGIFWFVASADGHAGT